VRRPRIDVVALAHGESYLASHGMAHNHARGLNVTATAVPRVSLGTIAREWGRLGIIGFGGPPTHIVLLRRLCVEERQWLPPNEFEDGIAATNLLPGPASTQLAIYCAWRLRGAPGALLGGICFICPGLAIILALSAVFLAAHPPLWIEGVAAGAGAAVPAVALSAAIALVPSSWKRTDGRTARELRWITYLTVGAAAAALEGPLVVIAILGCGLVEFVAARDWTRRSFPGSMLFGVPTATTTATVAGGLGALTWVALKVGALSYGGGFVIIPLMQHDAVSTYHWMTSAQFLNAVALGQVTPGPVVQTVAVVGYAASGLSGGLLAAVVAFAPSFLFVMGGARHFDQLRSSRSVQSFLTGAGASAIGAIAGSSVSLGVALGHLWQVGILGLAVAWMVALRRGVVLGLVGAGIFGMVAVLCGAPVSH
jgi:chromate transporter